MKTVAVLAYHKIGEPSIDGWKTWNYISEANFSKQLQYLQKNNWNVINAHTFIKNLQTPESLRSKSVLITFDDGYRSNLQIALPILKKFLYPAIVFVPTSFVGNYNAFDADIFYEPREEICTWEELKELEQNNISIESHGLNHRHFSKMSISEQTDEISKSKEIIELNLKKKVNLFSFPYGDNGGDPFIMQSILQDAKYKAAFLYGGGPVEFPIKDKFQLARVAVGSDTDLNNELEKYA